MLRFSPIEQIARKILKGVLVMPTIVYCYSEPVVCEISAEEYERRSNMPRVIEEETGRMARRYIREYDEIHAEMIAEKDARAEKFRKTHNRCKKSKNATPADRKRNKMLRIRKLYGLVFEDGKRWYYEYGSTGFKKTTEPDSEIFRNLKIAEMEKSAYAELLPDPEWHVGKITLTSMMHRLWKIMIEMQKPYEKRGCDCFERYYYEYDGDIHHICYYNTEYYDILDDYEVLLRWSKVLKAQKCGVTMPDTTPEDVDYFCSVGKRTFDRLMKQFYPGQHYIDDGWKDWRDYQDELDEQLWKDIAHLDDYLWGEEMRGDRFLTEEDEEDSW